MKNKAGVFILKFLFLLFWLVIQANALSAQKSKSVSINLNAGTLSLGVSDPNYSDGSTSSFFLAPSVKINRSEFMLGPLWSQKGTLLLLRQLIITPGLLAGFNYHILKDPRLLQFILQYKLQLVRWSGEETEYIAHGQVIRYARLEHHQPEPLHRLWSSVVPFEEKERVSFSFLWLWLGKQT